MSKAHQRILVVECYRHTLAVMHSLKKAGFRVVLGISPEDESYAYLKYSNAVDEIWEHPSMESAPQAFIDCLMQKLQSDAIDAIYPVGELSLRLLNQHWASVIALAPIIACEPQVSELCMDKARMSELIASLDIAEPASCATRSINEAKDFRKRHPGPLAVKPLTSEYLIQGEKCVRLREGKNIEDKFDESDIQRGLLLQPWIEGRRHNCMFVAHQGKIIRYFESEVLAATGVRGTGYSVFDRSRIPDLNRRTTCKTIVEQLNYTGIGCIQFLVDQKSGDSWYLEFNPRTDATMALPVACGMDLPAAAAAITLGINIGSLDAYRPGIYRHWLMGDIENQRKYSKMNIGLWQKLVQYAAFVGRLARPSVGTIFSFRDPYPAIHLLRFLIVRKLRKLF